MKSFALPLVLSLFCPVIATGQTFPYREKTDFANGSDRSGELTIRTESRTLKRGEPHRIKYTFHALGSYAVYNWQFNSLKPLPGQLAIYDANKQYIGDLKAWMGGSRAGISDDDWTFLYGETYLGKPLDFRVDYVPNSRYDFDKGLPLGTYYIQLILYRAFLSPNPFRTYGDKIDFDGTFDRSELCRSNAIELEIVDQ